MISNDIDYYKKDALLPQGWKIVKVGEYVISVKGKKPKRVSTEKTNECPIPYVNIKAFEKNVIDEYTDGVGCAFCEEGDFLMVWDGSRSGYVGKAIKGALGSTLVKLNFPDIYNNYAYYFLQSKYIEINTRAKGVGIPHVDPNILWNYDLLIPPKETQYSIVSKIEELLSELDKSIENLRTAQQQLKTYRQAVLKWAFEGKLTEAWRKKNGTRVRPSQAPQAENEELPERWEWVRLGDVSKVSGGLTKNAKRQNLELQLPFLRVANVYFNFLDLEDMHTIGITANEIERVRLEKDDLLFVEGNGSIEQIGRVALWDGSIKNCVHQNHLVKARLSKQFHPKYALHYYCSKIGRDDIKRQANSTSGLHTLSLGKVSNLRLPLCQLEEQAVVVEEIERRLSVSDKLQETINQSLQQAEALRQSILKKAFEGKLVAVKEQAKVIPIERKALACHIINLNHSHRYFGLTKFQKMLYVCEQFAEVEYETDYEQERAGPYDREFTISFKQEMSKEDWFQTETKVSLTHFLPGANAGKLSREYVKHFRPKGDKIRFVLGLLQEKTLFEAELIATIYAVWNNTIIKKLDLDVDAIISDVYNWSNEKAKYTKQDIGGMFNWMNEVGLVPNGFGKEIKKAIN